MLRSIESLKQLTAQKRLIKPKRRARTFNQKYSLDLYAERLFSFPDIGPLSATESVKAIKEPMETAGEAIEADALQEIFRLTKGYPYFL